MSGRSPTHRASIDNEQANRYEYLRIGHSERNMEWWMLRQQLHTKPAHSCPELRYTSPNWKISCDVSKMSRGSQHPNQLPIFAGLVICNNPFECRRNGTI